MQLGIPLHLSATFTLNPKPLFPHPEWFFDTMKTMKKYALYLLRWQLSTPILAICLIWLAGLGELWATIVANLIGGLIFFWVDKWIFKK
jgi:hypothetical protein